MGVWDKLRVLDIENNRFALRSDTDPTEDVFSPPPN